MKFREAMVPVPCSLAAQYWSRAYNRADSASAKRGKSVRTRQQDRDDSTTWAAALQIVVDDVENAIAVQQRGGQLNAKEQALVDTKNQ